MSDPSDPEMMDISLDGDRLSLVGMDLQTLPTNLGEQYGNTIKHLDVSFNRLSVLNDLNNFKRLISIVADNNTVDGIQQFPRLESVKTFSVNNNHIADLKLFLDSVQEAFPNLRFLSMLKNPACPNYFTGKDSDDYQRYRYYVLFRLRQLKFLDSTPVTDQERSEAIRVGSFALPARPDPAQYRRPASAPVPDELPELSQELKKEGQAKASFGVSNYVYYGRQSEGNRFIVNEDL